MWDDASRQLFGHSAPIPTCRCRFPGDPALIADFSPAILWFVEYATSLVSFVRRHRQGSTRLLSTQFLLPFDFLTLSRLENCSLGSPLSKQALFLVKHVPPLFYPPLTDDLIFSFSLGSFYEKTTTRSYK